MKKILVTGGAGYIGSHTLRLLLKNNYKPIVIDNFSYGHRQALPAKTICYRGDIGNKKLLHKIFKKHAVSAVMHFSAYAYVGESVTDPQKYYNNNLKQTLILLNTMLKFNIKAFVFSSTCATFGEPTTAKITETHPQKPVNPYGRTKLMVEKILQDYHQAYNLNYMILRYFNAAGADKSGAIGESHRPETHLIPLVLQNILGQQKELKIFGTDYPTKDGTCIRDYIHVNDLAQAHLLALDKMLTEKTSDHFNLGTQQGCSVKQIIKLCEKISGKKATTKLTGRRPGDPAQLIADSKKAQKILNWQPLYTIEDIIKTAWHWEKNRKY